MTSLTWRTTGISTRFIDALQSVCRKHPEIEKVLLFGSRARGDYRPVSDIDVAVVTKNATHTEQNLIEHAINELPTPLKIDVVFVDRLTKEKLITNIAKEGVCVYEQGKAA